MKPSELRQRAVVAHGGEGYLCLERRTVAACPSAHGDHAVLGAHGRVQGQPAAPAHEGFSCTPPAYCGDNLVHEVGVSLTRIGGTPLRMDIARRLGDLGDIPGGRVVLGFGVELN